MTKCTAALSILLWATDAAAQSQINGRVVGTSEVPLSGVHIVLRDSAGRTQYEAISDNAGAFTIRIGGDFLPSAFYLRAEMMGYGTIDSAAFRVEPDQQVVLSVQMDQAAIRLRPLTVVGKSEKPVFLTGFRERAENVRKGGGGYVIDRAQLERDGNLSIGRVLARVPGLRFVQSRRGTGETVQSTRGNCQPRFYIDGVPMIVPDVSSIMASTLEGVEVYSGAGAGPAEYFDRTGCGVVLMWSRRGERGAARGYPIIGLAIVGISIATLLLLNK